MRFVLYFSVLFGGFVFLLEHLYPLFAGECVCVCVCVCTCARMHACVRVCLHACVHVFSPMKSTKSCVTSLPPSSFLHPHFGFPLKQNTWGVEIICSFVVFISWFKWRFLF